MNEQHDEQAAHWARVRRTNTNWTLGSIGALFGVASQFRDPHQREVAQHAVIFGGEAGNIAHRIQQETGDLGLGLEVGAVRGWKYLTAIRISVATVIPAIVGLFLIGGSLMSLGRPESAFAILGVLLLLPPIPAFKWLMKVCRENQRLKITGMPQPAYLRHAGYVDAGTHWVKPVPGQTVAECLAAHGIPQPPTIDVQEH